MWNQNNLIIIQQLLAILSSTHVNFTANACFLRGSIGHLILSKWSMIMWKSLPNAKYTPRNILQQKEFTVCFVKIHITTNDVPPGAPRGVRKKTFRARTTRICLCVYIYKGKEIYIYISFSLVIFETTRWSEGRAEWARKTVVREKKVEGWSGPEERWSRQEKGETLNRCNSFSWTSAKSYIVSGPRASWSPFRALSNCTWTFFICLLSKRATFLLSAKLDLTLNQISAYHSVESFFFSR